MINIKSAGLGESMILSLRNDISRSSLPLKSGEALDETAKDRAGTVQAGTLLSVLGYMLYTEPLLADRFRLAGDHRNKRG